MQGRNECCRPNGVPGGEPQTELTDGVSTTIAHQFGPPLSEAPGFTELSTNSGMALPPPYGDGQWHERAYRHSEYHASATII